MPGPEEIGNLNITVGVDIESAKAGLQSVKAEMESVGPTADGASQQTQDAISRVIGRLDDIISILDGVEEKTKSVTDFSKRAWGTAADAVNPYISAVEDLEDVTTDAAKASEKTGGSINAVFGKVGETLEKSTSGVRKFVGSLSSTVGVVTGMVGAVTGLIGVLSLLKRSQDAAAEAAKKQSRATNDLIDQLNDYRDAVVTSTKESEEAFRSVVKAIDAQNDVVERSRLDALFLTAKEIKAEKDLEAQIAQTQAVYEERSRVEQEARAKQIEGTNRLNELLEAQRISLLPDDEQLQAQAERQKKIILDTFGGLGVVIDDDLIAEALRNIDRITEKQLEAEREKQRIADEAQRARDAESAAKQIESAQRAAEAFARGLDGIFGADFTTRLDNLTAAVRDGNNAIRRLK